MGRLEDRLAALATMSPAQLRDEWQELFAEDAPALPVPLLRRALAHRLQERAFGGLPSAAERMLQALAHDPSTRLADPPIRLKPGTRLLREWNGTLHAVLVTEDGFLFGERRFASLSHVARVITGAHWSGPRFFGLSRPAPPAVRNETAHG